VNVTPSDFKPPVNQAVTFTAAVTPTSVSVDHYEWNFGDGTPVRTTTGATTAHAYSSAGRRVVTVTAVAVDGSTGVGTTEVVVQ
jgi:uncharacterized membrane protein